MNIRDSIANLLFDSKDWVGLYDAQEPVIGHIMNIIHQEIESAIPKEHEIGNFVQRKYDYLEVIELITRHRLEIVSDIRKAFKDKGLL